MDLPCKVLRSPMVILVTIPPPPCTGILSKVGTPKCHNITSIQECHRLLDGRECLRVLLSPIDADPHVEGPPLSDDL